MSEITPGSWRDSTVVDINSATLGEKASSVEFPDTEVLDRDEGTQEKHVKGRVLDSEKKPRGLLPAEILEQ